LSKLKISVDFSRREDIRSAWVCYAAPKPKLTAPCGARLSEHHFHALKPKSPYLSYAPRGAVSDHFDGSAQTQALRTSMERKENDFEA
jgi:hypothetical protein